MEGALAQLARAMALQAIGQGFESLMLHTSHKFFNIITNKASICKLIRKYFEFYHFIVSCQTPFVC